MVLLPKSFRPCTPYTFSARALGKASYTLTAQIEHGSSNDPTVVVASKPVNIRTTRKITMTPPCDLTWKSYYIKVTGTGGANFTDRQYLNFNTKNLEIIIQTDKKLYKPGQTVKYRVFGVKPDLQAVQDTFEVTVTDPKNNKIQLFTSNGDSYGVVENELKLSSEPIFGTWQIKASTKGSEHVQTFKIEKYVLPKAEAKVIMPSVVGEKDTSIYVKVSSQYTFGKPVSGLAEIRIKVNWYATRKWQKDPATGKYGYIDVTQPDLMYEIQLDKNGEASVSIPMTELKTIAYRNSISYKTIVGQVNVTDKETGAKYISQPSQVSISRTREKISFALNPQNYKPGFVNKLFIELRQQDGKPVQNPKTVTVTSRVKVEIIKPKVLKEPTTTPKAKVPVAVPGEPVPIEPVMERMIALPYPKIDCESPEYEYKDLPNKTLSVPANGLVPYDLLVTEENSREVTLKAVYDGDTDVTISQTLTAFRSPSNTFLSLTLTTPKPASGQKAEFVIKATREFDLVYYTVLSRGSIVLSSFEQFNSVARVQKLVLPIESLMAPKLRIIAYIRVENDEIVADAISFNVEGVFKNKVSLKFDAKKVKTGSVSTLAVEAFRGSNVYAVAVDKSTTLLGEVSDDHSQDVQDFLHQLDNGFTPYYGGPWLRGGGMIAFRKKREALLRKRREAEKRSKRSSIWWPYPFFTSGTDVEDMFRNTGLHVVSDALIYQHKEPRSCYRMYNRFMPMMAMADVGMGGPPVMENAAMGGAGEDVETRSFFPETWIWDSQNAGSAGIANFTLKVPDTITTWVASAFAISKNPSIGVGMTSDVAELTVFKEFFVSLNLPYSVIRGEEIRLQATVFNYLGSAANAEVRLENPKGYVVVKVDNGGFEYESTQTQTETVQVPNDGTASVFFTIRFLEVGNIDLQVYAGTSGAGDRVVRPMLVEAEGIPQEYNEVVLVDLDENQRKFNQSIQIRYPSDVVPDSQRIIITAFGDPLGSALNNIEDLIRLPSGCGEQNMINFVPNIYIRKYLDATGQLSSSLAAKIKSYLQTGYTTELRYKRSDYSFSAFGDRDDSGSQWLTAYVLRTFIEASAHIYVDDRILSKTAAYLISNQNPDGTFREPGRVIHKELKGSSFEGDGLNAFTLIALLEVKDKKVTAEAIKSSVTQLEAASATMTNIYDLAITAYALHKAGSKYAAQLLAKLESKQTSQDGMVYWDVVVESDRAQYYWNPPHRKSSPVNIEATAYVLLTYAEMKEKLKGLPILRWLISQQNGKGGYSTSQDTVVALQALSEYATNLSSGNWDVTLDIFVCRERKRWKVSKSSATIQRKWVTKETTSSVDIVARGQGRAVVMSTVKYNIAEVIVKSTWGLRVATESETKDVLIIQACFEWTVKGESSGMSLLEVGLLSGYTVDEVPLNENKLIKRMETAKKKFTLYIDEVGNKPICIKLRLVKAEIIGKLKPGFISIIDYYNPENSATASYKSTLGEGAPVCALCPQGACGDCVGWKEAINEYINTLKVLVYFKLN
ncbi:hypothetical protein LOTGIDRAFT_209261 [Lottia gigantea]|uniref:CD109 antigen n=1 Tax=Lottia gigantea TaxID=225164 RepID=V3ZQP2_LOTGI|nr:hypothetical protein LOTGIDRAFT_209261 [Lottia gigantea]ESO93728.1 hypothetical protein LOTGIDRAFT_209261 [Lottia gigantea]